MNSILSHQNANPNSQPELLLHFHDALGADIAEMSSTSQSEFFIPEGRIPKDIADWTREYGLAAKNAFKDRSSTVLNPIRSSYHHHSELDLKFCVCSKVPTPSISPFYSLPLTPPRLPSVGPPGLSPRHLLPHLCTTISCLSLMSACAAESCPPSLQPSSSQDSYLTSKQTTLMHLIMTCGIHLPKHHVSPIAMLHLTSTHNVLQGVILHHIHFFPTHKVLRLQGEGIQLRVHFSSRFLKCTPSPQDRARPRSGGLLSGPWDVADFAFRNPACSLPCFQDF